MRRRIFTEEHDLFRGTARAFFEKECVPRAEEWTRSGAPGRDVWRTAGEVGLLGWEVPEEFGGSGISDFRFNAVLAEELIATGGNGPALSVNNDIVLPYLLSLANDEQR